MKRKAVKITLYPITTEGIKDVIDKLEEYIPFIIEVEERYEEGEPTK